MSTITNRCATEQKLVVGIDVEPIVLAPGETVAVSGLVVAGFYRTLIPRVTPLLLAPAGADCALGTGTTAISMQSVSQCPVASFFVIESNATGGLVSAIGVEGARSFLINPALNYEIRVALASGLIRVLNATGAQLAAAGGVRIVPIVGQERCALLLGTAEKAGLSVQVDNRCPVPVAVQLGPETRTIPARSTITYQTAASTLHVAAGSRGVTTTGTTVVISLETGFCAPSLGGC